MVLGEMHVRIGTEDRREAGVGPGAGACTVLLLLLALLPMAALAPLLLPAGSHTLSIGPSFLQPLGGGHCQPAADGGAEEPGPEPAGHLPEAHGSRDGGALGQAEGG